MTWSIKDNYPNYLRVGECVQTAFFVNMWVYCQHHGPDVLLPPLQRDGPSRCSQSIGLMMHKVSGQCPPPRPHNNTAATHTAGALIWLSTQPLLATRRSVLLLRPPPCFLFVSWRPRCVISHKLTMLHISYLSRSPSPARLCHDNQYYFFFFWKRSAVMVTLPLFPLIYSQFLAASLSLESKWALLHQNHAAWFLKALVLTSQ